MIAGFTPKQKRSDGVVATSPLTKHHFIASNLSLALVGRGGSGVLVTRLSLPQRLQLDSSAASGNSSSKRHFTRVRYKCCEAALAVMEGRRRMRRPVALPPPHSPLPPQSHLLFPPLLLPSLSLPSYPPSPPAILCPTWTPTSSHHGQWWEWSRRQWKRPKHPLLHPHHRLPRWRPWYRRRIKPRWRSSKYELICDLFGRGELFMWHWKLLSGASIFAMGTLNYRPNARSGAANKAL